MRVISLFSVVRTFSQHRKCGFDGLVVDVAVYHGPDDVRLDERRCPLVVVREIRSVVLERVGQLPRQ